MQIRLSEEALQIAVKRREVKSKGEKDKLFSTFLSLSHIIFFFFFSFKPRAGDYTTKQVILNSVDSLEKEMATHSSTLAWKIPWMEEPGRLQSVGLQRLRHN